MKKWNHVEYILWPWWNKIRNQKWKGNRNSPNTWKQHENTAYQKLLDTAEAELRENFIALSAYIREKEESQIKYLNSHLKNLKKEEGRKKAEGRKY